MLLSIAFVTLSQPTQLPMWTPSAFRDTAVYKIVYEHPAGNNSTFERKSDGLLFNIYVTNAVPTDQSLKGQFSVDKDEYYQGLPSKMPFGREVRTLQQGAQVSIWAVNNYERIRIDAHRRATESGLKRIPNSLANPEQTNTECEPLIREIAARFAARRRGSSLKVTIAGQSVPAFTANETNVLFVDLESWGNARKIILHHNYEAKRFTFSLNGQTHLMCWGTDHEKVGDKWRNLPDVVMYDANKLWIPLSAVED